MPNSPNTTTPLLPSATRRDCIGLAGLATCILGLAATPRMSVASQQNAAEVYIDESTYGYSILGVGALVLSDISNAESWVRNARQATNFHLRLRYNSTNKFKIKYAKYIVDQLISDQQAAFYCVLVNDSEDQSPLIAEDTSIAAYRKLIGYINRVNSIKRIITRTRSLEFSKIVPFLSKKHQSSTIEKADIYNTDLLQVADFLVHSAARGDETFISNVKNELNNYLKERLDVTSMQDSKLRASIKFKIVSI